MHFQHLGHWVYGKRLRGSGRCYYRHTLLVTEVKVNCRSDDQGQDHRYQNAADHRDSQRLKHLRASAQRERQGQHAGDGGERRHHDGAQAATPGLQHGVLGRESQGAKFLVRIQQQNSILGHDPHHHDHSHEGRDVECGASDYQRNEHSRSRQQGGSQNGQRRRERSELKKQHDEHENNRQSQYEYQVAK